MEVKLIVLGGRHAGKEVPVAGPKFVIGRAPDCSLRARSDLISRRHAEIHVEEGTVSVRDLGSKNGTFVNAERVESPRELNNADHLKIGPLEFEVQLAVGLGGKKKAKVRSVQEAAARTVESAADDELDISGWLEEEEGEAPPSPTSVGDTHTLSSTQTVAPGTSPTDPADDTRLEKPKQEKKPERTPGRFRDAGGPSSESSQAAADQMLRRFFGRRG